MALSPIAIRLMATGAPEVMAALRDIAGAGQKLGSDLKDGATKAKDALVGVAGAADKADASLDKVDGRELATAASRAQTLHDRLEGVRNTGGKMAMTGAGGMMLSRQLADAAREGEGVEQRLKSILAAQGRINDLASINEAVQDVTVKGHFADDDEIRDAAIHLASFGAETENIAKLLPRAARQVRTGFGTMESVADGMGKAISNFDLGALSRSGLVFTAQEKAAAAAAKEVGGVAGQMQIVEILMSAIDRNTVSLEDSLTATEAAANDAARALNDSMENAGKGVRVADENVRNLVGNIAAMVSKDPEVQKSAGMWLQYANYAAIAAGSLIGVVAQIGMAVLAFPGLGKAARTAFGVIKLAVATTLPFLVGLSKALLIPFAILAAGVAVGIAGYEALRATGLVKGASTADIISHTKKMLFSGVPDMGGGVATGGVRGGMGLDTAAGGAIGGAIPEMAAGTRATTGTTYSITGNVASTTSEGVMTNEQYAAQIEALQREKRNTKDKARRKEIDDALFELNLAKKHAAAQNKEQTAAQKAANELRVADMQGRTSVRTTAIETARNTQKEAEQAALDARLKTIDAEVEAGMLQREQADAERDALRSAHERRQRALDAATQLQITRIEQDAAIAEASATGGNVALARIKARYAIAAEQVKAAAAGTAGAAITAGGATRRALAGLGGMPAMAESPLMLAGADGMTGRPGDFNRMLLGGTPPPPLKLNNNDARMKRLPDGKILVEIVIEDALNKVMGGLRR